MNIIYVYKSSYDDVSAHGKQVIHTCNALVEQGNSVTLTTWGDICSFADNHDMEIKFDVCEFRFNTPVIRINRAYYLFRSIIKSLNKDVIFTRKLHPLNYWKWIPSRWYPPVIYEAHHAYHKIRELDPRKEAKILEGASAVIAISEGVRDDLNEIGVPVDEVIHDAAPLNYVPIQDKTTLRGELDLPENATIFVYSGSFDKNKNDLELVVKGFSKLLLQIDDAFLLMIGGKENGRLTELERFSQELNLSENEIRFTGTIPHKSVFSYLKASDIGIVPLNSSSLISERYTSPLKLFEYLISGLAVVGSDVTALMNIDDSRIHYYDRNSRGSFTAACITAADTYHEESIEQYTYDSRAKKILKIAEPLLSENN